MSDKMLEYITNQQTGVKTVCFCSHILSANQSTVQQEVRSRLSYTDNLSVWVDTHLKYLAY